MYEGIGGMHILQPKEVIHSRLLEKQEIAEEDIRELEQKKSYLEWRVKESEGTTWPVLRAPSAQWEPFIRTHPFLARMGSSPLLCPKGRFLSQPRTPTFSTAPSACFRVLPSVFHPGSVTSAQFPPLLK